MGSVSLGEQPPLVTIDDFLSTYKDPESTGAQDSKDFLRAKGSLPLTYHSPDFLDINILAAWLFWSGSIGRYYKGVCNIEEEYQEGLEDIAKRLDLSFTRREENGLYLSKNGTPYTREISKLGIHVSHGTRKAVDNKVKNLIKLPDYVRFLAKNYEYISGEDKRTATKCLSDQCRVLLFSRLKGKRTLYLLRLIASKKKENVERLAEQVLEMFNAVYPAIGLNKDSVSIWFHNVKDKKYEPRNNYYAEINLYEENVSNARIHYGLFRQCLTSSYHPKGKIASARR